MDKSINSHKNSNVHFGKFKKIVGHPYQIDKIRPNIPDKYLTIAVNTKSEKTVLYLMSGKHFNKLVSLMKKHPYFGEVRRNLEKFMGIKPKKININQALEKYYYSKYDL